LIRCGDVGEVQSTVGAEVSSHVLYHWQRLVVAASCDDNLNAHLLSNATSAIDAEFVCTCLHRHAPHKHENQCDIAEPTTSKNFYFVDIN
jgi:hypothetical protein